MKRLLVSNERGPLLGRLLYETTIPDVPSLECWVLISRLFVFLICSSGRLPPCLEGLACTGEVAVVSSSTFPQAVLTESAPWLLFGGL